MAENQGEMNSAMTEAASSKFVAAQIEKRSNLSWAQILTKSISDDQKSANKYTNQAEPECSSQKSTEQQGKIEQSTKKGYLDLSSDRPQNQRFYALSLSSRNQLGVVSKGSDTGGQPNPSSGREKGEVRGASSITGSCSHCKRRGHEKDRCWFLYPHHLKPAKKKGGGKGDAEKKRGNGGSRKGEKRSYVSAREETSGKEEEMGARSSGVGSSQTVADRLSLLEAQFSRLTSLLGQKIGRQGPSNLKVFSSNKNCAESPMKNGNIKPSSVEQTTVSENLENKCQKIGFIMVNAPLTSTKWVLDSGATDHMTGNQNMLKNYRQISGDQYFTVANNEKIKIRGWGMISIFSKKFLQDVYYVENCSVNLLSISKLVKDLNCEIIFKENSVIFQDLVTKEKFGEGG